MKRRGQDAGLKMQISKHEHSNNEESFARAPLGSFEKADEEELRKRKIIRVKRSTSSGNQPSNFFKSSIQTSDPSTTSKNPFAGINLATTNARPQTSSDPFYLNSGPSTLDADEAQAPPSRFGAIELGDGDSDEEVRKKKKKKKKEKKLKESGFGHQIGKRSIDIVQRKHHIG